MYKQAVYQGEKFEKWCFSQAVELEHTRSVLEEQKKLLEKEREKLRWDREEFEQMKESKKKLLDTEAHIFQMKLDVLKKEYQKLAQEKQYVERQRKEYGAGSGSNAGSSSSGKNAGNVRFGTIFFNGVFDEASLKKRYKDLMKIYHPDNAAGDTTVLQEINMEYDVMKKNYGVA